MLGREPQGVSLKIEGTDEHQVGLQVGIAGVEVDERRYAAFALAHIRTSFTHAYVAFPTTNHRASFLYKSKNKVSIQNYQVFRIRRQ